MNKLYSRDRQTDRLTNRQRDVYLHVLLYCTPLANFLWRLAPIACIPGGGVAEFRWSPPSWELRRNLLNSDIFSSTCSDYTKLFSFILSTEEFVSPSKRRLKLASLRSQAGSVVATGKSWLVEAVRLVWSLISSGIMPNGDKSYQSGWSSVSS